MTEQELRDMPLHENRSVGGGRYATRVPGGWIYEALPSYGVFVPDPLAWTDAIAFALRRGGGIPVEVMATPDKAAV